MSRMIEVVIDSVRVSLTNQQRIVLLREVRSERYLAIWIGPFEAESITIALQEVEVARPQTHDLLKNVLTALNARLLRVEVISLKEDVYFGNLVVDVEGHTYNIDSRPSDALALAVRAHVPILIDQDVMDTAGITPEEEGQVPDTDQERPATQLTSPVSPEEAPEPPAGEDRLSVFEDFLDNLDLDDKLDPGDEDEPKPDQPKSGKD
jgi:bifunctional DNase/RNase